MPMVQKKPVAELDIEDCAAILALFVVQPLVSEGRYTELCFDLAEGDLDVLTLARQVIAIADREYA